MEATGFDALPLAVRHCRQWGDFWGPWCNENAEQHKERATSEGKVCAYPGCKRIVGNRAKTCKPHAYWYRTRVTEPMARFLEAVKRRRENVNFPA